MEVCCLDHFTTTLQLINIQLQGAAYSPKGKDVQHVSHSHFSVMLKKNAATTTKQLNSMLDCFFQNGQMVCEVTM